MSTGQLYHYALGISCPSPTPVATPTSTPTPTATASPTPTPSPATPTPTPIPCVGLFSENFDNATPPALPAGWRAFNAAGAAPLWVTSAAGTPAPPFDSALNAAFINDPSGVSDRWLHSPSLIIPSATAQLSFRNNYNLEASGGSFYDGGVLEISIDGGATFTDILAAGGSFVSGGYNGTISTGFSNPIAGRMAWSGNSGGFLTTTVNLPAAANGQAVVFRWRMGSDTIVASGGWRIDTVQVFCNGGAPSPTPTPTATPPPTATATATASATPTPSPSPTPTPTPTPCVFTVVSYTGPAVPIPDNDPAGVNIPLTVSGVGTITDLDFRFDGTASSTDPSSTTVGVNHSWIGDLSFILTSPWVPMVAFCDQPGVPASTFGCSSNNLYQLTLDDWAALPVENQCPGKLMPAR